MPRTCIGTARSKQEATLAILSTPKLAGYCSIHLSARAATLARSARRRTYIYSLTPLDRPYWDPINPHSLLNLGIARAGASPRRAERTNVLQSPSRTRHRSFQREVETS